MSDQKIPDTNDRTVVVTMKASGRAFPMTVGSHQIVAYFLDHQDPMDYATILITCDGEMMCTDRLKGTKQLFLADTSFVSDGSCIYAITQFWNFQGEPGPVFRNDGVYKIGLDFEENEVASCKRIVSAEHMEEANFEKASLVCNPEVVENELRWGTSNRSWAFHLNTGECRQINSQN